MISVPISFAVAQDGKPDWREQNAYTLAVQAYLYTFLGPTCRNKMVAHRERLSIRQTVFDHFRQVKDASYLGGGSPNNDTLYSRAWLYLKDEPVILTVPAISDRYHSVEMTDFMDDNFAYVGTRATGDEAGNYAIVGPDWKGSLPAGVKPLPPSSTPWATFLGRTYVKDAADLDAAHAIQDKYKLTPLSQWGKAEVVPPKGADLGSLRSEADPLNEWKTINRAMIEVPPPRATRICFTFARIGVGPGLDVDAQDASTKRGLARAAGDGRKIIAGAFAAGYGQTDVNGWNYPPPRLEG